MCRQRGGRCIKRLKKIDLFVVNKCSAQNKQAKPEAVGY
jgi:hypothetical protein